MEDFQPIQVKMVLRYGSSILLEILKLLMVYQLVGGSMDSAGPVIVDNWVFVNSGYSQHGQMAGNVILLFL